MKIALKPCRECKAHVSTNTRSCPHCGVKNPVYRHQWGKAIALLGGIVVLSYLVSGTAPVENVKWVGDFKTNVVEVMMEGSRDIVSSCKAGRTECYRAQLAIGETIKSSLAWMDEHHAPCSSV